MTLLEDIAPEAGVEEIPSVEAPLEAAPEDALGPPSEPALRPTALAIAGGLSALAPAFLIARLFRGGVAPYVATSLGVIVGVGMTWLSFRSRRTSVVQCLTLPVAAVVGTILIAPSASGGSANVPSLVVEALRAGGLRQAPVAFDPGWRFVCVVLLAGTAAAAIAIAASTSRPQLLALVPLPLTAGAAFIQPKGAEVVSSAVAIVFVVGGLAVAYGAALAGDEDLGGKFEARRLGRGAGLIAFVLVILVALAQTDALFPAADRNQVIPPQKPPPPVAQKDRVLFTVTAPTNGPWRVGVLDVYQDNAFLLPSIDPARTRVVRDDGVFARGAGETYAAAFELKDLPGHALPLPALARAVRGSDHELEYDPRTNGLKVRNTRIPAGMKYTVTATMSPDAKQLAAAPAPSAILTREFAAAPPAPTGVQELLASLPAGISAFDRLQAVRHALYSKVVAAGSGRPIDITPNRVDALLRGTEATPYEITAAEVLLARWVGLPARIGFGFSGGDKSGGTVSFRPRDGAAWLEAYFGGYGWVPIVGTPPRAKASISPEQKKKNQQVVSTDELAVTIYVPVQRQDLRAVFELVRYWLAVIAPFVAAAVALFVASPGLVKEWRRRQRRRWAVARAPGARVAVAYAEMRDRAQDLNIGRVRDTPLEFVDAVVADDEHTELAWLVTRALWGDLARDLHIEDVEAAEDMAASVRRRLTREQTGLNRALAWTSRASLRDPYNDEIPNPWPQPRTRAARRLRLRPLRRRRLAAAAAAATMLIGGSCSRTPAAVEAAEMRYPRAVPATVGPYTIRPEPELAANYAKAKGDGMVQSGRVYTVRAGDVIQGSIQVALFKDTFDLRDERLRRDVEEGLNAGVVVTQHIGIVRLRAVTLPEQQIFVWFPPGHNVMELFVMRKTFRDAQQVVNSIIQHQRGLPTARPVTP